MLSTFSRTYWPFVWLLLKKCLFSFSAMYWKYGEKAMAPHSSTVALKIPWMEEPGGLQSMGSLRGRHDWVTSLSLSTFIHWRSTSVPPMNTQDWSLLGCTGWMLSRLVIVFLPRSKRLLISWLQSPSAVIFEPPKIKLCHFSCFCDSPPSPDKLCSTIWCMSLLPICHCFKDN